MVSKKPNASRRRAPFPEEPSREAKATRGRTTAGQTPVTIRGVGVAIAPEMRAHIRKHLGLRLGKFAQRVRRVEVRLLDESGPTGAPTCTCRLAVYVDGAPDAFVETQGARPQECVDTAIDRMERTVRRSLQRIRAKRGKAS